jgi:alkylhydroperoxidase family enzyme
MAVVNPVPEEKAPAEAKEIYQQLKRGLGKVPNIFAAMAHRPEALKTFLPFYTTVTGPGTVEPRYKELAYLKVSMTNACEY